MDLYSSTLPWQEDWLVKGEDLDFAYSGLILPQEYLGREQTYLKHRVLQEYLQSWAFKLASLARGGRTVRLWYIDCFSGPWKSQDTSLTDSSIYIGLNALGEALRFWKNAGLNVKVGAIFVEKNPQAFEELKSYIAKRNDSIRIELFNGEFGAYVDKIQEIIEDDPAFIFVDPTGWTGAAMKFIRPLVNRVRRDVMVNVMYDHLNRFIDHPERYLREQMSEFFDIQVPSGLSEEELIRLYKDQLSTVCNLPHCADLIVQYPTKERTKFRLVLGSHDIEALRLFRDVERKVIGKESPIVRAIAKENECVVRTLQPSLTAELQKPEQDIYGKLQREADGNAIIGLQKWLSNGPKTYGELEQFALAEFHITSTRWKQLLWNLRKQKRLLTVSLEKGQRSFKSTDLILNISEATSAAGDLTLFDFFGNQNIDPN